MLPIACPAERKSAKIGAGLLVADQQVITLSGDHARRKRTICRDGLDGWPPAIHCIPAMADHHPKIRSSLLTTPWLVNWLALLQRARTMRRAKACQQCRFSEIDCAGTAFWPADWRVISHTRGEGGRQANTQTP